MAARKPADQYWKERALLAEGKKPLQASARAPRAPTVRTSLRARPLASSRTYKARKPAPRRENTGIGDSLGSLAGGILGSAVDPVTGGPIGKFLGGKIGHLAESIMGFGDYKVRHNSVLTGGMSPPVVSNAINKGGIVVRHREYIGDVTATQDFTVRKFPINPGNVKTFPWLSQGAAKTYEIYRLQGLLFEFVSTSSDAVLGDAANSSLGTINMATDYDALDDPYPDKVSMLNAEFSNSSKPSVNVIHPVECAKSLTPVTEMYISDGEEAHGDERLNNIGNFYLATEGQQVDGGVLGELWCTYEVFLMKTQLIEPVEVLADHFALTTVAAATWLANPNTLANSTLGGVIVEQNKYVFPNDDNELLGKRFLCTLYFAGSSSATIGEIQVICNACALLDMWSIGATDFIQAPAGGSSAQYSMYQFAVEILTTNVNGTYVSFGSRAVPGGTVTGDFVVTEIPFTGDDSSTKKKKAPRRKRLI